MKILRIILSAAMLIGFVGRSAAVRAEDLQAEQVLTLEQSLQRAMQNNQQLLSSQTEIKISEQRIREVRAEFYPQASVYMSGSHYLAEQNYVIPAEFGSTVLRPSKNLDPDTFYAARVWMSQPLYNGGRIVNNIRLAQTNLERARIESDEIRNEVLFNATKAFYDVLLWRKQIRLAEDALRKVEALSAQISPGDARRRGEAEALQSRLRRGLSEKQRESGRAYLDFLNTLGVELYTRVDLQGELETSPVQVDLPRLLAWAQESRLEIRQTDYQKEIDRLTINLSQAERYPVVALGAGYEINDRKFPLKTTQWNTTLSVSLPLFDGFSSRARIREKRLQVNQNRLRRTEIEDKINLEVRESHADLIYWRDEMQIRKAELDRADNTHLNLQKKKDPADLALAEEWLLQARESYWTAVHGHRVSLARMEKVIGRPLKE
jgi:outer membrane protein